MQEKLFKNHEKVLWAQHIMYKTANLNRSAQVLQFKQMLSKLDTKELVQIDMVQSETNSRIQSVQKN
jgi:hypothetical protein